MTEASDLKKIFDQTRLASLPPEELAEMTRAFLSTALNDVTVREMFSSKTGLASLGRVAGRLGGLADPPEGITGATQSIVEAVKNTAEKVALACRFGE
jgi:hypothetical protein